MSGRTAAALAAVLMLAAAPACTGDDDGDAAAPTTTEAATTSTTREPAPALGPAGEVADLATVLPTELPSGFDAVAGDADDVKAIDLEAAVTNDSGDGAREALTGGGFVRGARREWNTDTGDQLLVTVYEFASPAGAESYAQRVYAGLEDGAPANVARFGIDGVPGGQGLEARDEAAATVFTVSTRDRFFVHVVATGAIGGHQRDRANQLSRAQYDRLQS